MFGAILVTILIIGIFVSTFMRMIKTNNSNYVYALCIEFFGILTDFVSLLFLKGISESSYVIIIMCSIVIPACIFLLNYKKIKISDIINLIRISFNKEDKKNILIDMIEKNPKNVFAHKMLAEYYEQNKEYENAEIEYYRVIDLEPNDYKMGCKLANILHKNKKDEDAIKILNIVLGEHPGIFDASKIMGLIYYDNQQFKEAAIIFNECLKQNPSKYELYYMLGMTYTRLNDFHLANDFYKKAALINSYSDISNLNLGQINLIFRDYESAEKYFYETIKSDDEYLQAYSYFYLAKIRLFQGREKEAIQYANLALEIYPKIFKMMEKSNDFIIIIAKLRKEKDKDVSIKISDEEIENIEHLNQTEILVEKLANPINYKAKEKNDIDAEIIEDEKEKSE